MAKHKMVAKKNIQKTLKTLDAKLNHGKQDQAIGSFWSDLNPLLAASIPSNLSGIWEAFAGKKTSGDTVDVCEILHQLIDSFSRYSPIIYSFSWLPIVTNWCRISSIHSPSIASKTRFNPVVAPRRIMLHPPPPSSLHIIFDHGTMLFNDI